ncbi:MAG: right-handed parallel beta-helix repeat-containing protein, partial [Acidimicrobiia bacterium]|nr:right-handed parallel beta-helix repeat-containing protein [Acidimicrobiia bacterium]MDX2465870.1 right-handed parallel beta-helix repeat-containing protein [Acidimicrobiia bacterium]
MNRLSALAIAIGVVASVLVTLPHAAIAAPGDAIVPGGVRVDPTYQNIGLVWQVSGDVNLNSTMQLEFRPSGASTWQTAAMAVRAYPSLNVNGVALGLDQWGASAMFLEPGTDYELRATISDPDGGGQTQVVSATTRSLAETDASGRHLNVVPGTGGGSGATSDPFRGLQAAADAAQPGDAFTVAAGTYAPFELTKSGTPGHPIAFQADGNVVIDGAGTTRGIVTIGTTAHNTSHIMVEGFVIRDGQWGIDAQNTQDILIVGNTIQDVSYGMVNRRDGGTEARQTICDNEITGRTTWPQAGIPSERGIDLRGTGNVVCHNTVRYFGDCVSLQPFTSDSFGNDVFGNDAAFCVDDGIEIDYNQANVRVWGNRVTNARMGVSVQPIAGGPAYIVRNEFFNLESVPIKMHNDTTGFVVAHNTGVKVGDGHGDNGAMWRNATFRNNVFIGTRYAFEFTTVRDEGFRDFDYNAWGTTREIDPGGPWFKWENVRYDRIGDLPTGVEDHGVEVGMLDLVGASLPPAADTAAVPGSADLRPASGSVAINGGTPLDNLNDGVTIVGNPDMGAFEYGFALPEYGPRVAGVGSRFIDVPIGSLFFGDIEWLDGAGITKGCNPPTNDRFCPEQPVTRGQMAAFLTRALDLGSGTPGAFSDDDGSVFELDIEALAGAGITKGCNPPTNDQFCPEQPVTRGQMAAFLYRALSS